MRQFWTKEEEEFLERHYKTCNDAFLTQFLNKTLSSIQHKAHKLGISKDRLWTQEEERLLLKHYPVENKKILEVLLHRNWEAIKRKAHKMHLSRSHFSALWTQEEEAYLASAYPLKDKTEIMNNVKRTWMSIVHHAKSLGIQRLVRGNSNCTLDFFNTWSSDSAYILGFVAADGCIHDNKEKMSKTFTLHLSFNDIEHLQKICDILSPERRIQIRYEKNKNGKTYKTCTLTIGSRYFCDTLINHGIVPRKSFILDMPNVPDQYMNCFIRGFFDGDGWIMLDKNNTIKELGFCTASKKFITALNNVIHKFTNIPLRNVHEKKDSTIVISYSSSNALKLCEWMYKDSTLHLDRKYNKYKTAVELL